MKKKIAFIMSVVMMGSIITGCGSSDSSSSSKEAASTKASSEASSEYSTEEKTTAAETTAEKTTENNTEAQSDAPTESGEPLEGVDQFLGKWACSEMTMNGQKMTEMPLFNIPLDAFFNVEIKEDGTLTFGTGVTGMDNAEGQLDTTCKWEKKDDNTITVETGKEDVEFVKENQDFIFDGDTFSFSGEEDGQTVEVKFKKVDEFPTYDMTEQIEKMSEAFAKSINEAEENASEAE